MTPDQALPGAVHLRDAWPTVAELTMQTLQDRGLQWRDQFGSTGSDRLRQALERHGAFIGAALDLGSPQVLERYIRWLLPTMEARGVPAEDVEETLDALALSVQEVLEPSEAEAVLALVSFATDLVQEQAPVPPPDPAPYDDALVEALLEGNHRATMANLLNRSAGGRKAMEVADEVIPAAMEEVGRRWQRAEVSVAEEHLAAATLERVLADLYEPRHPSNPAHDCVLACVEGNRHAIGLRIAADVMQRRGWKTRYLGADVPTPHLVELVERVRPEVLLLSVSMDPHVPTAIQVMEEVRAAMGASAPWILLGGRPFRDGFGEAPVVDGVGSLRVLEGLP